jgi:hypothetical protein
MGTTLWKFSNGLGQEALHEPARFTGTDETTELGTFSFLMSNQSYRNKDAQVMLF